MSTTTTTGTLTAGSSKTFNLAPGSALSLTLSPNVRVTITETPESVSGSGVGGNTTRVHEPQLPGTFAYGPYAMGGVVVVAVASNSGSSVAWTRKDTVVTTDSTGTSLVSGDGTVIDVGGSLSAADDYAIGLAANSTYSFRVATAYRVWQGVCYWNGCVITTSDRDSAFTISNTIGVYSLSGTLLYELTAAYAGTDPGGKKMSFGSPYVQGDYLYVTAYNFNDGGSPLISRVVRFTLNPATYAVALDTGFGTSGAQSIGSDTAEQVSFVNGEWYVCYYDQSYIRRFNTSWVSQGTMVLSQAFPGGGGPQAMIWEDSEATVYLVMHGPNANGAARSSEIHKYTRSGTTLTYASTLTAPGYGLTQGSSAAPFGYVWADRPNNRVWFTPKLIETPLRAHAPRAWQTDLYKPTLSNGWTLFDATYDRIAKVYFDIQSGRVWLEGMIAGGTTTNGTVLFNVPAYMRPKYSKNFAVVSNDAFGAVGVVGNNKASGTSGDVVVRVASATWLSLDGVSWQVDD